MHYSTNYELKSKYLPIKYRDQGALVNDIVILLYYQWIESFNRCLYLSSEIRICPKP